MYSWIFHHSWTICLHNKDNETITLVGKGLSWKCAHFMQIRWKCVHFLAFSGKCMHFMQIRWKCTHFMQIRWKCAHFLAFSGKCAHFMQIRWKCAHFKENAHILCKLGENACIFLWKCVHFQFEPLLLSWLTKIGLSYIYERPIS